MIIGTLVVPEVMMILEPSIGVGADDLAATDGRQGQVDADLAAWEDREDAEGVGERGELECSLGAEVVSSGGQEPMPSLTKPTEP
ncbi:hypothetical protein [Singulisphaera sp. PoT]|uniref:hypothetical protein n=1 Tax=Singulisphaera sp. PoT TaxID=3411797 RepID=UPI003BF4A470